MPITGVELMNRPSPLAVASQSLLPERRRWTRKRYIYGPGTILGFASTGSGVMGM